MFFIGQCWYIVYYKNYKKAIIFYTMFIIWKQTLFINKELMRKT